MRSYLAVRSALVIAVCLGFVGGPAVGQQAPNNFTPPSALVVTHAAVDPMTGDLLIVSNAWREVRRDLRRFHADGSSDPSFVLQRYEACCEIQPSLVTADSQGDIYSLEYGDELGGFYIYKHTPTGDIVIDWGEKEGSIAVNAGPTTTTSPTGGYEAGQTSLDWNAGGGRLHFYFSDPVDLITRADGTLLVLDRIQMYVYLVSADGRQISQFIGKQGYIPRNPMKMLTDQEGYIYLIDYYDRYDINRAGMTGLFRFTSDGTYQEGWGEVSGGINDPGRPEMDINTLVIDGSGRMIALGGRSDVNHSEALIFDRGTGALVSRGFVQYRMGRDDTYLGILGRLDGGFIVFDGISFEIQVSYYTADGVREKMVAITDLYSIE